MAYKSGLALELVDTLPDSTEDLFNPWVDICLFDQPWNTPAIKLNRLEAHLDCDPKFILCGEAPGYQGCRHSGIAFTSEELILNQVIPRVSEPNRLTTLDRPVSEPSATAVWNSLNILGIAEATILWNALQMHPHKVGNARSNRTPRSSELEYGKSALIILRNTFPNAIFVAVGVKARNLLNKADIDSFGIRHPSRGGSQKFAYELDIVFKSQIRKFISIV